VDDDRVLRGATATFAAATPRGPAFAAHGAPRSRRGWGRGVALAAGIAAVVVVGAATVRLGSGAERQLPMTLLVEGRVAMKIPEVWTVQRITRGPGSARVQAVSPSDHDTAVHMTQSPVPAGETLPRTAETLGRALAAEPPGVFVDFNPAGAFADRPAVTYRETRQDRDIRWAVILDGGVRISVGCQSARGREDAVRYPCEQAVASAHSIRGSQGTIRIG
jgi:type VII secretion-associated protein (TIGR03931 family)